MSRRVQAVVSADAIKMSIYLRGDLWKTAWLGRNFWAEGAR